MSATPDAQPACCFYVEIGRMAQAVFAEVSGLNVEMFVQEVEEGGVNHMRHRLPGPCQMSNLVLRRGLAQPNEFLRWIMQASTGEIKMENLSIVQYTSAGQELFRWNFINAYPVKWSGPQFQSEGGMAAFETVELAHAGLSI